MEIVSCLLPDSTDLRLDTWRLNEAEHQITLTVTPIQTVAHRPVCDVPARRIHSRYTRTLADLPWGGYGVRLQLHVRKFFCTVAGLQATHLHRAALRCGALGTTHSAAWWATHGYCPDLCYHTR
jgi:transposase